MRELLFVAALIFPPASAALPLFHVEAITPPRTVTFRFLTDSGLLIGNEITYRCSPKICIPEPQGVSYDGLTLTRVPVPTDVNQTGSILTGNGIWVAGTFFPSAGGDLYGINDWNVIVGSIDESPGLGGAKGFVSGVGLFGVGEGADVLFKDINNSGTIIGTITDYSSQIDYGSNHGFVFENGMASFFPAFVADGEVYSNSFAVGINNLGQVIGQAYRSVRGRTVQRPFIFFNEDLTQIELIEGHTEGAAIAINDLGIVIGYSRYVQGPDWVDFPVVALDGRRAFPLDLLLDCQNCSLDLVFDINNRSQILAAGTLNGTRTQMLLTPIDYSFRAHGQPYRILRSPSLIRLT